MENATKKVKELKERYRNLFTGKMGKMKHVSAKLEMSENAQPKFFKPRPVPFALKDKISDEIKRLEKEEIIEKVKYSDYAAPIVPIQKPSGAIRICGDFKVTCNPYLKNPEYPFPTTDELFTKLNGGEKFTKLDLSQCFQQIPLDEKSRDYVCINTHIGLYRFTRVPNGITSGPSICQEAMEKVLNGIENCGVIMDDIILTGKNDDEHLHTLEKIFQRLEEYNLKLNPDKCYFLQESVEYFAFKIDKHGIHPTDTKLAAMKDAPLPSNKDQLKSWLGLVNYYRRFISHMSTEASELNELTKA